MKILLVEDEPRLAATVSKGLQAAGFVVVAASNGLDGLWHATEEDFDTIVLDIMLPVSAGTKFCDDCGRGRCGRRS